MLALRCPVRHFTTDALDYLALGCVRPRHLVIDSISPPFYEDISHYTDQTAAVNASSVTHAVLIVECESKDYEEAKINSDQTDDVRWETVQKRAVRALAVFQNLTHARLVFYCNRDRDLSFGEGDLDVEVDYEDLNDLVRDMRDASLSSPRSPPPGVLAACPALRCFIMTVAGRHETEPDVASQRWVRTRAWQEVNAGEGKGRRGAGKGNSNRKKATRTFEELSDYDARRVIEDEDMGLPEAWERKLEACGM